jgi:hypothetical protein
VRRLALYTGPGQGQDTYPWHAAPGDATMEHEVYEADLMIRDKIRRAKAHLAEGGVIGTMRWAVKSAFYYPVTRWIDSAFDRKYGTDTRRGVRTSDFDVDPELARHAVAYQVTPIRNFRRFMKRPRLDWPEYTFIDLGCGKGLTLLLASSFPFRRIVGVEFEPGIHAICEANIRQFLGQVKGPRPPVDAIHMSAADYQLPSGNILLYLFNPFDEHVMAQVTERLREALAKESRSIRIVYSHPNHTESLLALPGIQVLAEETFQCRKSLNNLGRLAIYHVES